MTTLMYQLIVIYYYDTLIFNYNCAYVSQDFFFLTVCTNCIHCTQVHMAIKYRWTVDGKVALNQLSSCNYTRTNKTTKNWLAEVDIN